MEVVFEESWNRFKKYSRKTQKIFKKDSKNIQERVVSSLPKRSLIRPFHVVIATIRNFSEHSFQFGQPPYSATALKQGHSFIGFRSWCPTTRIFGKIRFSSRSSATNAKLEEQRAHDAQITMQVETGNGNESTYSEAQSAAEPTAKMLNSDAEFE